MGGTDDNAKRLSGLVALLPLVEQQAAWETISSPLRSDSGVYPPMGPPPWVWQYRPWRYEIPTYQCPSAAGDKTGFGLTNYTFCIGDAARQIHQPERQRGAFACLRATRMREITDGLANTIAMAEIGIPGGRAIRGQYVTSQPNSLLDDPGLCVETIDEQRPQFYDPRWTLGSPGRGGRWADGAAGFALVNTILPPNQASCAVGGDEVVDGVYSAGSFHQGGGHVMMADGAVIFITDSIEAGDRHQPTPTSVPPSGRVEASPYGLWGALGTAGANDVIEEQLNQ